LLQPGFATYREQLKKFYAPDYGPAWSDFHQPGPQARAMIDLFEHANLKGLLPDAYDGPKWQARLQRFNGSENSPAEVAAFDVALSVSAMRYISDLHGGRVSPRDIRFNVKPKQLDAAEFLRNKVLQSGDVKTTVQQLEPGFQRYLRMLKAVEQYTELARQPGAEQLTLPAVPKPISRGQTYSGLPQLAQRLRLLGDLPPDAQLPAQPDLYGGALVQAMQRLQRRHGLADDGKINAETLREASVSVSERLAQLQRTLERWRWLPANLHSPLVVVNIPEFQLRAYSDGAQAAFATKVIVGKAYNHHTPLFLDEMEYVIFRPYWNVPTSIARNEIIPALRRNPGYLSKHNMQVITSDGMVVSEGGLDADTMRQLRSGRFDIRQRPGAGNSLGLVKFVFPNEYDVYLHGTPERRLFARARRDFSHGCMRVEDPEGFAQWVLKNDSSWTPERIHDAMYGSRTLQVNLPQHIPVLIFYATAMVDENGEVRFFTDLYGLDAVLQRALDSASR
jgi:L,D-transpeptidase YcbB